jgi:hypothetical protein
MQEKIDHWVVHISDPIGAVRLVVFEELLCSKARRRVLPLGQRPICRLRRARFDEQEEQNS